MSRPTPRARSASTLLGATLLAAALLATTTPCSADTVASLLGNFTINQFSRLKIADDSLDLHYVVVYGQLPALRELHLADRDGDGVTSQSERDAYAAKLAQDFAPSLVLNIDGRTVPVHAVRWTTSLPAEQGGFSLRVDVDYQASLPPAAADLVRRLDFVNRNYDGRIGWNEIVVHADKVAVFDTDAFSTSLTDGLASALQSLPESGPLNERSAHLRFAAGAAPAGSVLLAARAGADLAPSTDDGIKAAAARTAKRVSKNSSFVAAWENGWITRKTRDLIGSISSRELKPGVIALALLGALLLGAVHALSPGHGKTIVGAYLIGSRGTPRHAAFLGMTVTVTHTIGVFILGFATLYASRFIVPERLFPILSLVSALLVLGMGAFLLVLRVRATHGATNADPVFMPVARSRVGAGQFVFAHSHGAASAHDATMHSHGGGAMHSHLPPGAANEKITWRSLLTLGISGGLVPCPSAMVLLLAAVALNKTAFGMILVVAFSLGLAATLTMVGLAFLYARNRFHTPIKNRRWTSLLPIASAGLITLLGIALCVGALKSFSS